MRKTILFLAFYFTITYIFSQSSVATTAEIQKFFKTKTLIVLENNPLCEYNFKIKEVIEKYWTITEYEYISQSEFAKKMRESDYSFLITSDVMFEKDKTGAVYNYLNLVLGGERTLTKMPDLCSVPLSYKNIEEEKYVYKLSAIVRFIQAHVKMTYENPDLTSKNIINHYKKNAPDIQNKTLYLIKDELSQDLNSVSKVKKYYKHKIKFVNREELELAIDEARQDVVFLHKVGPGRKNKKERCFKVIVGADDAKLYYFDYHKINSKKPNSLLKSDLKNLSK